MQDYKQLGLSLFCFPAIKAHVHFEFPLPPWQICFALIGHCDHNDYVVSIQQHLIEKDSFSDVILPTIIACSRQSVSKNEAQ